MFYYASLQCMYSKRDTFSSGSSSRSNDNGGGGSNRRNFIIVDGDHSYFVYGVFTSWT